MSRQPSNPAIANLSTALAASGVTLLGTLFFTAQRDLTFVRAPGETFSNAFSLAVPAVAVYLLVLFGLGFAGVLRRWWTAALAGLLAAFVGSTLGYALQVISNGLELSGETWGMIFGEFVGLNVQFSVAGVLAAALLCPPVYRRLTGEAEPGAAVRYVEGPSSIDDSGSAFVRIPSTAMLEDMDEATRETANTQWEAMVAAFEEAEWGTQAVPEAEDERLAVFVGDTALVLGEQVIPARPKQDARRGEFGDVRETLAEAGAVFDELEAPAVFDPADVVEGIGVLYVGVGGATNASAVRGLRSAVRDRGYEVVAVPVAEGVRLSDAASVLPDGTKLVWEPGIRNPEVFGGRVATAEPSGAAVVALDEQTIAVPASAPKTRALLGELGYVTVELDISVFEEAGGSLPRLSLRSRD